jgi:putative tryptophan/tyrosine transport system substrate-binding protein
MSPRYRRRFLAALAAGLALPQLVSAQRRRDVRKLGALWVIDAATVAPYVVAFKKVLGDRGWVEGRTIEVIVRYDDSLPARRPEIAAEVVAMGVDVLFVFNAILPAARKLTRTIPMVCGDFYDPIVEGFTTSLARPSDNVTGVSWNTGGSAGKRVQIARDLKPRAQRIGFMTDLGDAGAAIELQGVLAGARQANLAVEKFELRTPRDIEPALAKLRGARLDVLVAGSTPIVWPHMERIVQVATEIGLPIVSEAEEFAQAGAVVTYGVDVTAAMRHSAVFVDRILRGAAPRDLPIEEAREFNFVVNLRTARTLGLTIPDSVMVRATNVIR